MDSAQILANALPFLMSYVLLLVRTGTRPLAENMIRVILPDSRAIDGYPREFAVTLALHFYTQLSFVFSLLLSSVAALGLTMASPRPLLSGVVVFLFLVTFAVWFGRWQTLGVGAADRTRVDHEMTVVSWVSTSVMLSLTLWARWSGQ